MSASSSSRLASWWDRFFHTEISPFALGLFRILFGYCLFDEVTTSRAKNVYAIANDAFHRPYFDWLPYLPEALATPGFAVEWFGFAATFSPYHLLHDLQYPLIVLFGLGLLTRVAGWPLLIIQAWLFFTDQLNFRNHPYFFMIVLMLMLLGPCDEALSVRAAIRAWRRKLPLLRSMFGRARPAAFQRLIQLSLCVAYFYAGVHKAHPEYFSGRILANKLEDEVMTRTSGEVLGALFAPELVESIALAPASMMIGAWLTVLLELALPFLLWTPRTRPAAMVVGIGFHLAIRFSMEITTFSYAMIGIYMLFLAPDTLPRIFRRALGLIGIRWNDRGSLDRSTATRVE